MRKIVKRGKFGIGLGNYVSVPAGSTVTIYMPSGDCQCQADVQATFRAGNGSNEPRVLEYTGVNYCSPSGSAPAVIYVGN